jgi:hypothetical protein
MERNRRVEEIDALKGALTLKMAASHLGFFMIPGFTMFSRASVFTFGIFLFCFALALGLARRTFDWRLPARMAALLVVGGCMTLAFSELGRPDDGRRLGEIFACLSLSRHFPLVDFLVPFLLASILFVGFQRHLRELSAVGKQVVLAASIGLACVGTCLDLFGVGGPLSALWGEGFRALQSLPIFALGFLLGRTLREPRAVERLRATPPFAGALIFATTFLAGYLVAEVHNATQLWNLSGDLGYAFTASLVAAAAIQASAGVYPIVGGVGKFLARIGRRSSRCLWLQLTGLPITGLIAQQIASDNVKTLLGAAFLALLAWLSSRENRMAWPIEKRGLPPLAANRHGRSLAALNADHVEMEHCEFGSARLDSARLQPPTDATFVVDVAR